MSIITSTHNKKIIEARKLEQRKHRRRQGCFLVEGMQLLHMAVEAGIYPSQVFYCEELFVSPEASKLLGKFDGANAELVAVSRNVMESLSDRDVPQGLAAAFGLFTKSLHEIDIKEHNLVLVLEQLQDPGNLGTLIRTADAIGVAAVIMIEPCVDVFDPKTVRGSMGSIFNLPLVSTPDILEVSSWLKNKGMKLVGTDPHAGINWGEGLWDSGAAIVLGNEARGLSEEMRSYVTHFARLPMVGKAESLNVAIAGSVFMYEWLKERSTTK